MICEKRIMYLYTFSNTSHPGYDIHYLIDFAMAVYTLILMSSDLMFVYFTLYTAFQYDLVHCLVAKVGDFKSDYNTPEKQSALLRKILKLHSDTMRFVVLYRRD